jgi:UDP:flavonoid glycosyltransferase YjiC (YdhE family)
MVLIPIAADQPDNARRRAELGVARVIVPDQRAPEAIRAAAREVLLAQPTDTTRSACTKSCIGCRASIAPLRC